MFCGDTTAAAAAAAAADDETSSHAQTQKSCVMLFVSVCVCVAMVFTAAAGAIVIKTFCSFHEIDSSLESHKTVAQKVGNGHDNDCDIITN